LKKRSNAIIKLWLMFSFKYAYIEIEKNSKVLLFRM